MWKIEIKSSTGSKRYSVRSASIQAAIGKALKRMFPDSDAELPLEIKVEAAGEDVLED